MKHQKTLQQALSGSKNIRFTDMVSLAEAFGFQLSRVNGSHHIFVHPEIPALLNLQSVKGQAKPYQIKQFLLIIEQYNLGLVKEEEAAETGDEQT